MLRKPAKKKHKTGLKLIALALIIIGLLILIDLRVRPIIEKTTSYQSKILATRIINDAVYEELENEKLGYDELVTLVYNDSGVISSIESNMVNINRLKSKLTKTVNSELEHLDAHDMSISLVPLRVFRHFTIKARLFPLR